MGSVKKLAKKVKFDRESSQYECLPQEREMRSPSAAPIGFLAIYVGEERRGFVVPTRYLAHPLFKIMLEKAYDEFGFKQSDELVVPFSVTTFQEVVNAVECCNGRFDFGNLVDEFI
ncbi:unnamed protein product [Ilex paraguariensis]|uniref:Small auxin up regulated protein n=1 Tax=Ilex paraguariensis TaxID=185542 RepID=A0ABC8RGM9_9AQUA